MPSSVNPGLSRPGYQDTVDGLVAFVESAKSLSRESLGAVQARVRSDAQAARAAVSARSRDGLRVLKKLAVFYLVAVLVLWAIVCVLCICLWLAGASALMLRYYTLSRVPGNHVIPLTFNAMPLYTEWWRNKPVEEAMNNFIAAVEQAGDGGYGEGASASFLNGIHGSPDDGGGRDDSPSKPRHGPLRPLGASRGSGMVVQTQAGKLLDFKLSFLQHYIDSILATSTLPISTGNTKTLFLPGGAVNLEAIFDYGSPMFSAQGVYGGRMQLVFLREDVGRHVSITVESAMLFAEDARSPQTLWSLDVLFQRSHALHVRTGELPRHWLVSAAGAVLRLCFFVPVKLYELAQQLVDDSRNAPFAPIDHTREVAVSVDLYDSFSPPLSLQSRLRAMNFTIYYDRSHEDSAMSSGRAYARPRLARLTFYSHVQLRGLAYYLATYPVGSFALTGFLIFFLYAAAGLTAMAVGGVALGIQLLSASSEVKSMDHREGGHSGARGDSAWLSFDHNHSFSSSSLSLTARPSTPSMGAAWAASRRGAHRTFSASFGAHRPRDAPDSASHAMRRRFSQGAAEGSRTVERSPTDAGFDTDGQPATEPKRAL